MTTKKKYELFENIALKQKISDRLNILDDIEDVYGNKCTIEEIKELLYDQLAKTNKRIDDILDDKDDTTMLLS